MAKRKHSIEARKRDIGDRLKKRRLRFTNITQETLAEELGIHYVSYGRIENGQSELTITKAEKLATYYGITIDELIGYVKDNPGEIPPIVQEEMGPYTVMKPVNVTFQIRVSEDDSNRTNSFLSKLGRILEEDFGDEVTDGPRESNKFREPEDS